MRKKLAPRKATIDERMDLAEAKELARQYLAEVARRYRPTPPTFGDEVVQQELLAEARYVTSVKTAFASECVLLTAVLDKDKASVCELRRGAADVLGEIRAWKQAIADIMRAVARGERLIAGCRSPGDVNKARDQAVAWLDELFA